MLFIARLALFPYMNILGVLVMTPWPSLVLSIDYLIKTVILIICKSTSDCLLKAERPK